MKNKTHHWEKVLKRLTFAFQPIVNTYTGKLFGVEALLRNTKAAGFEDIHSVFDRAYKDGMLHAIDLLLREKAVACLAGSPLKDQTKLFYNLDNRVVQMKDYQPRKTLAILEKYSLEPNRLCFEISERHSFENFERTKSVFNVYKNQSFKIAIDDFGTGFSGFEFLYHFEPDLIKIDRFFISNIQDDPKKRLFLSYLVNVAHLMGIMVIAEGIETEYEYYFCKNIGCDLLQGFLIQKPVETIEEIRLKYAVVEELNAADLRKKLSDESLLSRQVSTLATIQSDSELTSVIEVFRKHKKDHFFPVVNKDNEPLGVIQEESLKAYAFSPYGMEVLKNKTLSRNLKDFITRVPVCEINTRVEKILELFSLNQDAEGILLTDNGKYIGFLGAKELLLAVHEKNLEAALNHNPLSKLPGNTMIYQYLSQALEEEKMEHYLIYYDFNHFKPFNDRYGFRLGDRAILFFADILRKKGAGYFIGHVGGDDFFSGFKSETDIQEDVSGFVADIIREFNSGIVNFYSEEDRRSGSMLSADRDGNMKTFPLLSAGAAVLRIPKGRKPVTMEETSYIIAELKKSVKMTGEPIVSASLLKSAGKTKTISCRGLMNLETLQAVMFSSAILAG